MSREQEYGASCQDLTREVRLPRSLRGPIEERSVTRCRGSCTLFVVRAPLLLALGVAVGLTACSDPGPGTGTGGDADESEALRLGRVHLVLSTADTAPEDDAFELTARFAMVRGLEEEFVRARADMPDLVEDMLNPGQCALETALWPPVGEEAEPDLARDLQLVDAGELDVQLGETRVNVPLSLVPDLLPYMSGVEYGYFAEDMAFDDADNVTVSAAGGLTDELPAFSVDSPLPRALELTYNDADLASIAAGALVVRWTADDARQDSPPDGTDNPIALRLTPLLGGEPLGDDMICLVADRGETRLELAGLHTLGFAADAESVRVEASRSRTSVFDVGAWSGTELVVERRDTAELPLR